MTATIDAVIFDLDGVLVDACQWHYQALNQALLAVSNTSISPTEHLEEFDGLPTSTKLKILVEQGRVPARHCAEVNRQKQLLTKAIIEAQVGLDAGKVQLLTNLRRLDIRIGCVTNAIRETAHLMLARSGQLEYFDVVLTNQDVVNPKPNPEGYILAMQALACSPAATLIVEDSSKGREAARRSGAIVLEVENAAEVTWERLHQAVLMPAVDIPRNAHSSSSPISSPIATSPSKREKRAQREPSRR